MKNMAYNVRAAIFALLIMFLAACGGEKSQETVGKKQADAFPASTFTVSATADTAVYGEQGTRIFIGKGTFQFADGTDVTGPVEIKVKEFYKKSDMILAGLTTASAEGPLETGGMLNILATSAGRDVQIKADKRIVVQFPKKGKDSKDMNTRFDETEAVTSWNRDSVYRAPGMSLFYPDNTADGDAASVNQWRIDTTTSVKRILRMESTAYPLSREDQTWCRVVSKENSWSDSFWDPVIDDYLNNYKFSSEARKEINSNLNRPAYSTLAAWKKYGIECEMTIDKHGVVKDPQVNSKVPASVQAEFIDFMKHMPLLATCQNNKGQVIERRVLIFIRQGEVVPLFATDVDYAKSFDAKYSKFEKRPIRNIDEAELEYYIFSVAKLGWINCDRFINAKNITNYVVEFPDTENTKVNLVFKDIDGVLAGVLVDGKFIFNKVPVGEKASVVVIRTTEGVLETGFQSVTISEEPLSAVVLQETTLAELKQQLEKLN